MSRAKRLMVALELAHFRHLVDLQGRHAQRIAQQVLRRCCGSTPTLRQHA
jgi:hypothetical protein